MTTSPELPSEQLLQKLNDGLNELFSDFYMNRGREVMWLRHTLGDLFDELEVSYETGEPITDHYFVDPTEREVRDLTEELSDLQMRRDEIRQSIEQGRPAPGDHCFLRTLNHQISTIKAELDPLVRPALFPLTQTEDNP